MRLRVLQYLIAVCVLVAQCFGQGELHFCLHADPKTFNPLMVDDDASETIRYLTGGVLVRLNRKTQQLEPELATSWKVSKDSRSVTFTLRPGLKFSDGTPFTTDDVAFTSNSLMDPNLHSPTGDAFRSSPGQISVKRLGTSKITITFPGPVIGLDKLFDQVAIMSAHSALKERAVLGPFVLADYRPGSYVLLKRNGNYWKTHSAGPQLPYLDSIYLHIQQNRDLELTRFSRGEIQIINALDGEFFDRLQVQSASEVFDTGPSLDSEVLWFNQAPNTPIASYKVAWFRSTAFRQAVSAAIN